MTTKIRKKLAINFARSFAAALVQNAEIGWQEDSGLTEDELAEAHKEMLRIAERIERTIKAHNATLTSPPDTKLE